MFTNAARNARRFAQLSGVNLKLFSHNLRSLPYYFRTWRELSRQAEHSFEQFERGALYPVLDDLKASAGSARGHYFHQDLYVARKVFRAAPRRHIDVGSRVDGFVAHVASFREIEVIDVRPLQSQIPGVRFLCGDLMSTLPAELVGACDSLSCLHALEHFGLGRYGDPIRYDGHRLGLVNLTRMLQPGGTLYLSTPISQRQRIEFNAHRVFSIPYLVAALTQEYEIRSLAYVDDRGDLHTGVDWRSQAARESFGLKYGCGIFEARKRT